jgi:AmiR/NasT family two-component response regulator
MSNQDKGQVLIVEDDTLVAEMVRGLLKKIDYTVIGQAIDGQQALDMVQSLQPDVVLMDIEMPNMDGIEATRRIFELRPTPVVVLTAYETPLLLKQASKVGVGAYLVKPPKVRDMERAITIAMARFEDMVELRRLNAELETRNEELQEALANVKTLKGLLPICASCKKIRNDQGYWQQVEDYIREHSEADFRHGLCPSCASRLYPEFQEEY